MLHDGKTVEKSNKDSFDVKSIIKYAIQSILPNTTDSKDADLVTRLCIMAAVPTGEEDPHEILRLMSDDVVFKFTSNLEEIQKNPISAPIAQFFFMEWCWRNDHLNADWRWIWDSTNEGHLSYSSKKPLEELLQVSKSSIATIV